MDGVSGQRTIPCGDGNLFCQGAATVMERTSFSLLAKELPYLVAALTPISTFFHDPRPFAALEQLMDHRGLGIRQVVVLGADPGLEAYGVALRLAELERQVALPPVAVLGLLLVEEDVPVARRGVYPLSVLPSPPPQWLRPWLCRHRSQQLLRIAPAVRARVRFRHFVWPGPLRLREAVDLLWCWGVFSLFRPELAERFLLAAARAVRPGGFLITDVQGEVQLSRSGLRGVMPFVYQLPKLRRQA